MLSAFSKRKERNNFYFFLHIFSYGHMKGLQICQAQVALNDPLDKISSTITVIKDEYQHLYLVLRLCILPLLLMLISYKIDWICALIPPTSSFDAMGSNISPAFKNSSIINDLVMLTLLLVWDNIWYDIFWNWKFSNFLHFYYVFCFPPHSNRISWLEQRWKKDVT